jgi:nitroreductase
VFLSAVLHRAEVDVFDQPDTTASDRMDLMDVIRTRRNLRRFKAAFAPESLLKEVLTTTRLALSACNSQSLETMVVRYEQTKRRLAAAARSSSRRPSLCSPRA